MYCTMCRKLFHPRRKKCPDCENYLVRKFADGIMTNMSERRRSKKKYSGIDLEEKENAKEKN